MKTIKRFTAILAMASIVLVACDAKKEKEYNLDLNDGTSVFYNSNDEDALRINGWTSFNAINETFKGLQETDFDLPMTSLENLNDPIANLSNSIPTSLKTEEVIEDIEDVQEEYTKLINEKNEPLDNVKQNMEELVEKFDDLREELNETVEDYITK